MIAPAATKSLRRARSVMTGKTPIPPGLPIKVGVDLGTAYTVILVTDTNDQPLAGATMFADVVRDGVVWDFAGAMNVVRGLHAELEARTGRTLRTAAVTIPPTVSESDHRAHRYVLEGVGIDCTAVVDEPTAANAVLGLTDGAVVDIGGGTTGAAILADGRVVHTFDQPSGGTHLSLVISGALGVSFEAAEAMKCNPANHQRFFPMVEPVLEKLATIVAEGIQGHDVSSLVLVGGTSSFAGIDKVMQRVTGIPCQIAPEPLLVTPLGVARSAEPHVEERRWRPA